MTKKLKKYFDNKLLIALFIGGSLGLFAAFASSVELTNGLKNPDYQALCSINPVISCGSVLDSKQGFIFGFSNSYLGMIGFSMILGIFFCLLAGAKLSNGFWKFYQIGTTVGFIFALWLISQSLFFIKNLCIYCMITWISISIVFWYGLVHNLELKNFGKGKKLTKISKFVSEHHLDILLGWFLLVILVIIYQFWYYWKTLI
ncbi:MAG: vitamin K epoxide reductase family protein [Patescibacteria group bacterium]